MSDHLRSPVPQKRPILESPNPSHFNIEIPIQSQAMIAGDSSASQVERMVILLHGYGETAQIMMDRFPDLQCLKGTVVTSLEALHPIYLPTGKTGSSWMTSYRREASIQNNLSYLRSAISTLKNQYTWDQLVLVGYSQGAQMAMRTAHYLEADHLIAIGGEIPPELRQEATSTSSRFRVSLMRGKKDMAYPSLTFQNDIQWYKNTGHTVETEEWPGGHAWSEHTSTCVTEHILKQKALQSTDTSE